MTPAPLSPELEQRIEEEADEAATIKFWSTADYIEGNDNVHKVLRVDSIRKAFYKRGAIPYAELWQEAEQRAERFEKVLKEIQAKAKRGIFPNLPIETMGAQMCMEIDQHVTEALTPKTGDDETE